MVTQLIGHEAAKRLLAVTETFDRPVDTDVADELDNRTVAARSRSWRRQGSFFATWRQHNSTEETFAGKIKARNITADLPNAGQRLFSRQGELTVPVPILLYHQIRHATVSQDAL